MSSQKTQLKSHEGVAIGRGRRGQRGLSTAAIFVGFHSAQRRRAGSLILINLTPRIEPI